jgi:hypothetical protein
MQNSKEISKKESKLITIIKTDSKLEEDLRQEYLGMARVFLDDLKTNLTRTSIELDEKYGNGIDTWIEFLKYAPIRKYFQSLKDEQLQVQIDQGLMTGEKNVIGLQKVMDAKGPTLNNSNFIMVRLPEKVDYE